MSESSMGLPPQLSNAISEQSPAGFLLFYINDEGGIQIHSTYDSEVSALALQNFCSVWTQALATNQQEYLIEMFSRSATQEDSPED